MYPRDFFQSCDFEQNSDTCFVAMPFADEYKKVWTHYLKPAIEQAGLKPVRTDENLPSSSIPMEILTGIAEASLVIADLTGGNPNVFYELGLAHSVKRSTQVILITQDIAQVPFDLRGMRCYEYRFHKTRSSPSVNELTEILSGILQEHRVVLAHVADEVMRALSPMARTLIEQNRNSPSLSLPYAIYSPQNADDVMVALPLWQGLSDLLFHRLVEFSSAESKKEGGYFWSKKAQRLFNTDFVA